MKMDMSFSPISSKMNEGKRRFWEMPKTPNLLRCMFRIIGFCNTELC